MIRKNSTLNDDDTDEHTDVSIGQIEFNARMAAREGRPEALLLLQSGATILPPGSKRQAHSAEPSSWITPPWLPENTHLYRTHDVGDQIHAALVDEDLDADDSIDLSTIVDEEIQLATTLIDPSAQTITQFFLLTGAELNTTAASPITYDTDSDDSDGDDDDSQLDSLCFCSHGEYTGQCPECKQCSNCCTSCLSCSRCTQACSCNPTPTCPNKDQCTTVQCTRCMNCTKCCSCTRKITSFFQPQLRKHPSPSTDTEDPTQDFQPAGRR